VARPPPTRCAQHLRGVTPRSSASARVPPDQLVAAGSAEDAQADHTRSSSPSPLLRDCRARPSRWAHLILCLVWEAHLRWRCASSGSTPEVAIAFPMSLSVVGLSWCPTPGRPRWLGFALLCSWAFYTSAPSRIPQASDPWPATFGYHEIFHACTVLGAPHFVVIAFFALPEPFRASPLPDTSAGGPGAVVATDASATSRRPLDPANGYWLVGGDGGVFALGPRSRIVPGRRRMLGTDVAVIRRGRRGYSLMTAAGNIALNAPIIAAG